MVLLQIGAKKSDSTDMSTSKKTLLLIGYMMSIGGLVWGSLALYFGFWEASAIPYGYIAFTFINFSAFAIGLRFRWVYYLQIFASILLPFLFQWSLGGFAASGNVMLWAQVGIVAAMLVTQRATVGLWLAVFTAFCCISWYYNGFFAEYAPTIPVEGEHLVLRSKQHSGYCGCNGSSIFCQKKRTRFTYKYAQIAG